jgi:hypothetical protein
MMKSPKKTTSKTTKKNGKTNGKPRKPNALHEKLIRLLSRPDGATLTETKKCGFEYPAIMALRIAERRGYKTSVLKKPGELTRYVAKRAAGA